MKVLTWALPDLQATQSVVHRIAQDHGRASAAIAAANRMLWSGHSLRRDAFFKAADHERRGFELCESCNGLMKGGSDNLYGAAIETLRDAPVAFAVVANQTEPLHLSGSPSHEELHTVIAFFDDSARAQTFLWELPDLPASTDPVGEAQAEFEAEMREEFGGQW